MVIINTYLPGQKVGSNLEPMGHNGSTPQRSSTSHVSPAPLAAVALLAGALVTALNGVEGPALSDSQPSGVEGRRIEVLFLGHTRATEATDSKRSEERRVG